MWLLRKFFGRKAGWVFPLNDSYLPKKVCSFTGLELAVAVVVNPPVKPFAYNEPRLLAMRVSFPIDLNARSVGA